MISVHFVFDDGEGVQPDGMMIFETMDQAKRQAIKALADMMHDLEAQPTIAAVAGQDENGKLLFSVSIQVTITDER